MISTRQALDHLFALADPVDTEIVPVAKAAGRVLASDLVTTRAQPPFNASAMDGYAVRAKDLAPGVRLTVIGEAPAGRAFSEPLGPMEAVRIFTGAPLPSGADSVIIQEDTSQTSSGILPKSTIVSGQHVRPLGGDFEPGDRIVAPRRLSPEDVALAAAMNRAEVTVRRCPIVAVLATGDELVQPGEVPREDQIIASNAIGLKALMEQVGAIARVLPIARDTVESLRAALDLADGADLIVTIGGASVGDHDLVAQAAETMGLERAFYKIAMRPGKPLMAGRFRGKPMVGLPGNPVSSMVCGRIFLLPMLRAMLGFAAEPQPRRRAPLGAPLPVNGPREHYMRARYDATSIFAFKNQDSSLLSLLHRANALLVRPPHDPAHAVGDEVDMIPLSFD